MEGQTPEVTLIVLGDEPQEKGTGKLALVTRGEQTYALFLGQELKGTEAERRFNTLLSTDSLLDESFKLGKWQF